MEKVNVMNTDPKVHCQTYAEAVTGPSFQSCNSVIKSGEKRLARPLSLAEGDVAQVAISDHEQKSESAKANRRRIVDSRKEVVETLDLDPKYHRVFVCRHAQLIQKISKENGGVHITFPRMGAKHKSRVWIKGVGCFVNTAGLTAEKVWKRALAATTMMK